MKTVPVDSRDSSAGRRFALGAILALALAALGGCGGPLLGVNLFVVGERSSLEKQVLGSYRALHSDFEAFGSVRGVDEFGRVREAPRVTDSKRAALRALQNQAYNQDDIRAFLQEGLVGEAKDGRLVIFEERLAQEPADRQAFTRAVVEEENADREILIRRLMETTPDVSAGDEARVRAVFASLNRDNAPAGARIQTEDGEWSTK